MYESECSNQPNGQLLGRPLNIFAFAVSVPAQRFPYSSGFHNLEWVGFGRRIPRVRLDKVCGTWLPFPKRELRLVQPSPELSTPLLSKLYTE
jgi:hypothetical protein